MAEVIRVRWYVVAIVAAVVRVHHKRECAHFAPTGFEREGGLQRSIHRVVARLEAVVVPEPVERGRPDGVD
jgi:hypothetical protein